MLHWAVIFFVIAIIAAVLGFGGIAASAAASGQASSQASQWTEISTEISSVGNSLMTPTYAGGSSPRAARSRAS